MASKAICSRLQKLEAEISELVAQHLKDFEKDGAKKCEECCRRRIEKKRSSSAPPRASTSKVEEEEAVTADRQSNNSYPSSRQNSPERSPQRDYHQTPKRPSIIKPPNDEPPPSHRTTCKCCQKKSVQFANCHPKKTYTVEELYKMQGRISSSSQRNEICLCDYAIAEDEESDLMGDTLNIQKTLFQMPSLNQTLDCYDSRRNLEEKLKMLENENKRLTVCLEEEAQIRKAFMEEARREIKLTEKMMDEKMAIIQQQAIDSMQQVSTINKNLMVALCDRENCLRKVSGVVAKLKSEQERNRCRCKFASNVCEKLRERNEVLEQEKEKFLQDIENARADSSKLKKELKEYKCKLCCLNQELDRMKKEKVQLQDAYNQTTRRAESQQSDLKRKIEIEGELDKLSNLLRQTEIEREQLNGLVQELRETVQSQKDRLEELLHLNEEQEVLLKSQKAALESKDEQIRLSEVEASILKRNSLALEQKLAYTEESLKHSKDLSKELDKARREILELKDTILLKEKIIKDQAETLMTLRKENERNSGHVKRLRNDIDIKCAEINRYKCSCDCYAAALQKAQQEASVLTDEFRKATTKTAESITQVKRMSVELESQNAQKQALLQDITALAQENQTLRNQMKDLEQKLENVCHYTSAGDMEKQQLLITYLEQQVALQQREWEIQKKVINKEKSKALQTAKFATKKLMETVKDFQKQTEMQRKVHTMLTNMLQEKEQKLQKITSKMGTNTKSIMPTVEEPPLHEVHEVCKKEFRVLDVRRSIYSPTSELTLSGSNQECSCFEDDEESTDVPSTSRVLPNQETKLYGAQGNVEDRGYLACFCEQDAIPEEEPCTCCTCGCFPCECCNISLKPRRYQPHHY